MTEHSRGFAPPWLALGIFAALWALLVRHLSVHWLVNPQYSFGWLVPFLAAYLWQQRWSDRPEIGASSGRGAWWIGALAALAFLPTWLIEQPNPDWRLVSWAFALEVITLTLVAVYGMGGWSWVKHFAFPCAFILTAIPWPTDLELMVIQNLTSCVTAATVETLNLCNIPALQHGNVIEIATGLLGIDEACSGVRSFQSTLMASLFLGKMYRFRWPRRVILLAAGTLLALVCNIGRAFFLGWKAAHEGSDAVGKYHDPAGFAILTVCFLLVWGLALWMAPKTELPPVSQVAPRRLARIPVVVLTLWLIAVVAATESWYRLHETDEKVRWSFVWPEKGSGFKEVPITKEVREMLKYDEGRAAEWDVANTRWTAFFFRWKAGPARSRILARTHRPDICLPASGYQLERDLGTVSVNAVGLSIPFQAFVFSSRTGPVHVFYCAWQDRAKSAEANDTRTGWNRSIGLDSVRRGERNLGQQVLELVLVGYLDERAAQEALRAQVANLIQR
jgi:exosortase